MWRLGARPETNGGVAQLGERLLCKQEVIGSIPFTSTTGGHLHQDLVAITVKDLRFEA